MRRWWMVLVLPFALAACGGTTPPDEVADLGGAGDAALQPFGAACAAGGECQSHVCFVGGNRSFCSLRCTPATHAADCPVPPTSGACNLQGYCKP